jgi:hypothetical protein
MHTDFERKRLLVRRGEEGYSRLVISPEDIIEGEWLDWYQLTPLERWHESLKLRARYLAMGGSLDPEPDTESPFHEIYFGKEGCFTQKMKSSPADQCRKVKDS